MGRGRRPMTSLLSCLAEVLTSIRFPLPRQRPFESGIVHERDFVGFGEIESTFETAADVVVAGAHSQVVGDGIEAIDKRFWKADKDGTFVVRGGHGCYLGANTSSKL